MAKMKVTGSPYEAGETTSLQGYVSVGVVGFVSVWVNAGALDCATENTDGLTAVSVSVV